MTALGSSSVAGLIASELAVNGVTVIDAAPEQALEAPVSSVTVDESSGDRSVVGGDARGWVVDAPPTHRLQELMQGTEVVLLDGHHPGLAQAVALEAAAHGLPCVLDAGRWKPVMTGLLPAVTDLVASADFRVPSATTSEETAESLTADGVPLVVVTAGADPVRWWNQSGKGEVSVPRVKAVDTLGAGDVFHGAWAYALACGASLPERIRFAAEVAATRCAHVGPRSWLQDITRSSLGGDNGPY